MLILTAKVSKRRLLFAAAGLVAVMAGLFFFFRRSPAAPTATQSVAAVQAETNEKRVRYLQELGWSVEPEAHESMQIRIPRDPGTVFRHYNDLQKSQGFDLSRYAGKNVMRYVYEVKNLPGASEPVYATLLVYKDRVIGGDITDTSPGGKVRTLTAAVPSEPGPTGPQL